MIWKQQVSFSSHSNTRTMSVAAILILSCQMIMGFAPLSTTRIAPSKALNSAAATEMPEGLIKTVTKPGKGPPLKLGDVASVKYSCYLPDEAPFARSEFQKVVRFLSACSRRLRVAPLIERPTPILFIHSLIRFTFITVCRRWFHD
jgi:hypothetical protein